MNYRHIYHAGNFADVLKHLALARIVEHLKKKDKAFRVIDTHAGTGLYDLTSVEAQKTGEWQGGIGRILGAELPEDVAGLLQPLIQAVASVNPQGGLRHYPGSPFLVRSLLRKEYGFTREPKKKFGVPAVFPSEALRYPENTSTCDEAPVLTGLNCAGFGSSVCVTAVFGLFAASEVLKHLAIDRNLV